MMVGQFEEAKIYTKKVIELCQKFSGSSNTILSSNCFIGLIELMEIKKTTSSIQFLDPAKSRSLSKIGQLFESTLSKNGTHLGVWLLF